MIRRLPAYILEERRMKAITMIQNGKRKAHIAEELGVSRAAVTQWWNEYLNGGNEALKQKKRPGRPPRLDRNNLSHLLELLEKGAMAQGFSTDLWTTKRIAQLITREFGVTYHRDHVCKLLHQMGLSWQKPKKRALERNEDAIRAWVNERWPAIKKKPRKTTQQ